MATAQFINQASLGGLFYFLGERTFNSVTIGISTVNLNHQILRPYGAFPHPNVLAFFFLLTAVMILTRITHEKVISWRIILAAGLIFSSAGLALTFSRASILLGIIFFLCCFLIRIARPTRMTLLGVLTGIFAGFGALVMLGQLGSFSGGQFLLRGIDFREELLNQSVKIFSESPYFGIGLNNFFVYQTQLIKTISPVAFQPPHNILVIALLSLGLFGWWIVPTVFVTAIRSILNNLRTTNDELRIFHQSILFLIVSIVIVGMFDHFFLTVEQGQVILALILGLSFARITA